MRSFLLNALTVVFSIVVTLLALEGALRFLPVAWAPPVVPPTPDNPIQRYAANTPFTWSIGWNFEVVVRERTNSQGFVADYDYDPATRTPLVAVVGDSFVEAMMVPFRDTVTGRLQAAMGERGRAYAFAQAGSALSQYVAYARHACAVYRPERLVVVIVGNDFDESMFANRQRDGVHNLYPRTDGSLELRLTPPTEPGIMQRIARRSALALYLVRNVKIINLIDQLGITAAQAQAPTRYVGNTRAIATPERVAEGEKVIDWFLSAIPQAACLAPRDIVLVSDAPRPDLYDPAARSVAHTAYFGRMRASLIAKGRAAGFTMVDLEPKFVAAFTAGGKRFEHPDDGHWNALGHAVVADAVREALGGWPPLREKKP